MIYGNTKGVKRVTLETLENLITDYDKNAFVDRELLATVAEISGKLNREICVYISRSGRVMAIPWIRGHRLRLSFAASNLVCFVQSYG